MTGAQIDQLETILVAVGMIFVCFLVYKKFFNKEK
jgi:hypothetical protein